MSTNSPEEEHEETQPPSSAQMEKQSDETDPGEEQNKDASAEPA